MRRYLVVIGILSGIIGLLVLRYRPETVLVEGFVGQPVNFNPTSGPRNEVDEAIESLLFKPLIRYGPGGELITDLAESYEVREEGRVYEIKIREDVFWHDDQPIVAADVEKTFSQDPAFSEVKLEVVSDKLVRFKLESRLASFLSLLTKPIIPSHLGGVEQPLAVVGSGDFKIQRIKRNGIVSEITLVNLGEGDVKKLVLKFFQSQAELKEAAKRGEIGAFAASRFAHPSFTEYSTPLYGQYFAIFFNLESGNKLAKNKAFRRAASDKLPVKRLIEELLGEGGSLVRGPMSGTWAEAELAFSQFQPKVKKRYRGAITLKVPNIGELPKFAEKVAESWQTLGVGVTVISVPIPEFEEVVDNRDFEAIILGQEVGRDPDRYSLWHSTKKEYPGLNIASYADPRADRALEEGREAGGKDVRKRHYLNFQRLFIEDKPAIFLYHPTFSYFVSRRFSGVALDLIFSSSERFWNIQEWKVF